MPDGAEADPPLLQLLAPLLAEIAEKQRTEIRGGSATMSRGRFAVTQFTSVLVALLTCLALVVVALTKVVKIEDLFAADNCGLANLVYHQLNISDTQLNLSCLQTS